LSKNSEAIGFAFLSYSSNVTIQIITIQKIYASVSSNPASKATLSDGAASTKAGGFLHFDCFLDLPSRPSRFL
jgi:ribonucleotide reductase beta subunit family protein with ferritin-like domain